jgi:hypothetical protein
MLWSNFAFKHTRSPIPTTVLNTDFKEFIELLNSTQVEYMVVGGYALGFASLGLKESDFLVPEAVIQLGYPPARIDLLTAIDGVSLSDLARLSSCQAMPVATPR